MTDETMDDPFVKAADFRRRVLAGEKLTAEEYRDAVAAMRTIRRQSATTGKTKSRPASTGKVTLDADSLLNDLI